MSPGREAKGGEGGGHNLFGPQSRQINIERTVKDFMVGPWAYNLTLVIYPQQSSKFKQRFRSQSEQNETEQRTKLTGKTKVIYCAQPEIVLHLQDTHTQTDKHTLWHSNNKENHSWFSEHESHANRRAGLATVSVNRFINQYENIILISVSQDATKESRRVWDADGSN